MIRTATDEDFRAFCGMDPAEVWVGNWLGITDGTSFGIVLWDADGRPWGFVDVRGKVAPITLHKAALRVLRALREVGEREVRAYCDDTPQARRWLGLLGFRNDGGVWICQV